MTEILDLDALVAEPQVVRFGGKEHEVPDVPVWKFVKLAEMEREVKAMGADAGFAVFEKLLDQVCLLIPDADREELGRLSIQQLNALMAFIQQGIAARNGQDGPNGKN